MIARTWKCIAAAENVPKYIAHFQHSVLPELRLISGYRAAYLMQRDLGDGVEITVMTLWDSLEAIRAFAGDALETAVVEPAAQAVLRSYDRTVTHSEVVLSPAETGA